MIVKFFFWLRLRVKLNTIISKICNFLFFDLTFYLAWRSDFNCQTSCQTSFRFGRRKFPYFYRVITQAFITVHYLYKKRTQRLLKKTPGNPVHVWHWVTLRLNLKPLGWDWDYLRTPLRPWWRQRGYWGNPEWPSGRHWGY